MDAVLSPSALEAFRRDGFVRTGTTLSPDTRARILAHYRSSEAKGAPVSSFVTLPSPLSGTSADRPDSGGGYETGPATGLRRWIPRRLRGAAGTRLPFLTHRFFRRHVYARSLYGSSELLPTVLGECLAQGLARHLADTPLLVGHDIFLENRAGQKTFGFHADGWNLEVFYQSDDDLSLYVPLEDTNETTGGRLRVERGFHGSERWRRRNLTTKRVGELCRGLGCVDEDGYARREAVEQNEPALEALSRLVEARRALPGPDRHDLSPIDARAGEVLLFNNKCFHDVEPWSPRNRRARTVYIVRCLPLYDVGLRPPTDFLRGVPCNRFALDPRREALVPFASRTEELRQLCVPLPR